MLWKRTFLDTTNPSNNTLGATAITTVSNTNVNSTDITPSIPEWRLASQTPGSTN